MNAVADALRVDRRTVASWVGGRREERHPWMPPEGADRLTRRQREALDNLIRVMVDQEDGDGHGQQPAPNTPTPVSPGNVTELHPPAPDDDALPDDVAADTGVPQPGFDSQDPDDVRGGI